MSDELHIAPLKEGFLDGFALGMAADGAAALVTGEVNFRLGFRMRLLSRDGGTDDGTGRDSVGFTFCRVGFGAASVGGTFGQIALSVDRFRAGSFGVNGDHNWIATLFEGFYGGFEGGEIVQG